ncbi:MAG: PKD domain-containing protein [Chitinophagaceae bacterium]|nr:PKD domain-containing protein [Chitinophagaceae bacterium]
MKTILRVFLAALLAIPQFVHAASSEVTPDFTADITQGCVSLEVNFSDLSVPDGDPIVSWSWDFGDGGTSGSQHPTHTYTVAGIYTVKLEIVTQGAVTKSVEKTNYIRVGNKPLVNLGKDTSICEGSSLLLDAGNPGFSYLWNTGATTQTLAAADEDRYIVEVSQNGCSAKDTINIYFAGPVTSNFSFDILNKCLPAPVQFTETAAMCPGANIISYLWSFGDGETSTEQNPEHIYTSVGEFTVKLTIEDESGFSSSRSKKVTIVDNPLPVVNLGADTMVCDGYSVFLNAENPGATYFWNTWDTGPEIEAYFSGEYWVEVSLDGCTRRDTIFVESGPALFADIGYTIDEGSCLPINVSFNEYSQSCNTAVMEWNWDFGDGHTSTEQNPTHPYTAAGEYTVTLVVKNGLGMVYTATQYVTIEGFPSPVVALGADTTLCEDNELILDAGNPGATYVWNTGETSQTISVYDPGKYEVTVTKDGCSATDSIKVKVVSALAPDFNFVKLSGCLPVKMQFMDLSTSCSGNIVEWHWQFGDGQVSDIQNPEHDFASGGNFPVRLRIVDDMGREMTRTKQVTIDPVSVSLDLGADTTVCVGSTLILDAGNPGAGFLWNTGETTQTIEATDEGKYYVTVNTGDCVVSDTIMVTASNAAAAAWSFDVSSECLPVNVKFTDNSEVFCGQSIVEWRWDFGDGETSTERNPEHLYQQAGSFVVRLFVTTSGGQTVSKAQNVYVTNTAPQLDLPSSIRVCRNTVVNLDAGIADATSYLWTPAIGLSSATIRNPQLTPQASRWYELTVTKCLVTLKDSIYVQVDSISKPTIIRDENTLKAPEATRYEWYRDGNLLGNSSRTLRVDRKGYYKVKVFNYGDCSSESDPLFVIPVSGNEKLVDGINVKCSPNPARDLVQVLFSELPKRPAAVTVIDAYGVRIFSTLFSNNVNTLNLAKLARGQYFVEVIINNRKKVIPIILH